MKLEITADKVKEAAAKCPQAEATLKTLFPEVFEGIDLYNESGIGGRCLFFKDGCTDTSMIAVWGRDNSQFYLSRGFNWDIITHEIGCQTLKPTKK